MYRIIQRPNICSYHNYSQGSLCRQSFTKSLKYRVTKTVQSNDRQNSTIKKKIQPQSVPGRTAPNNNALRARNTITVSVSKTHQLSTLPVTIDNSSRRLKSLPTLTATPFNHSTPTSIPSVPHSQ